MLDTAVQSGKPWFMTVAPASPHTGINASTGVSYFPIPQDKWADAFPDAVVPRTPNWNPDKMEMGASWLLNAPQQNQSIVDQLDDMYRRRIRCVAGLDEMVGQLIDALDDYGILENTHVIYTSDNGYHIGQHRMGPGKKQGWETDVNIPMLWRGPGIAANHTSYAVSTHTDLAPTFLNLFGLDQRTNADGRPMPEIVDTNEKPGEHINIELWGSAAPYEVAPLLDLGSAIPGYQNNTYKGLRIISDDYSLYYSVWCTNEHELYDMSQDNYQNVNLLPNTLDITKVPSDTTYIGRPLCQVVSRLDTLLMVLKTCTGKECTNPWEILHPQGDVENLADALDSKFDDYYAAQPKVEFTACMQGYIKQYEGDVGANVFPKVGG